MPGPTREAEAGGVEDPQVLPVPEAGVNLPVTRTQGDKQCGPSILPGHLKGHADHIGAVFHPKNFKHNSVTDRVKSA